MIAYAATKTRRSFADPIKRYFVSIRDSSDHCLVEAGVGGERRRPSLTACQVLMVSLSCRVTQTTPSSKRHFIKCLPIAHSTMIVHAPQPLRHFVNYRKHEPLSLHYAVSAVGNGVVCYWIFNYYDDYMLFIVICFA